MDAIIEAQHLCKEFKNKRAVNDLTFSIQRGEIFGLLGHNGAGKTTTIRLLTGQIPPTSGSCSISGYHSFTEQHRVKPLIGIVPETQNVYGRMSGYENLLFFARLYGVKKTRVNELLEQLHLKQTCHDRVDTYSNGMRQRLLIARALLHHPQVIFFDEPTRGLDPTSAREIRELIRQLADTGITIFLTTHNMEEADSLCHRVAFIKSGSIIVIDTPQNLKIKHGARKARITLANQQEIIIPLSDIQHLMSELQTINNQEILMIHSQEATLEDIFIYLAGKEEQP